MTTINDDNDELRRFIQSDIVDALLRAARKLGFTPSEELAGASLSQSRLSDSVLYQFWEKMSERGAMQVATALAHAVPLGDLGLLDYVIQNSPSLDTALHHLTRHLDYSYKGVGLQLAVRDDLATLHYRSPQIIHLAAQWTVAFAHTRLQRLIGDEWTLREVSFQFATPEDPSIYPQYFKCPVKFGAQRTALVFPMRLLDAPIAEADPNLYKILCRQLDNELRVRRKDATRMDDRIRVATEDCLRAGDMSREAVAAKVGILPSQLSTELAELGHASITDYIDEVRRELAERWLVHEDVAIGKIARSLGYTDSSNFTRACKRWFGCSPSALRKGNRA